MHVSSAPAPLEIFLIRVKLAASKRLYLSRPDPRRVFVLNIAKGIRFGRSRTDSAFSAQKQSSPLSAAQVRAHLRHALDLISAEVKQGRSLRILSGRWWLVELLKKTWSKSCQVSDSDQCPAHVTTSRHSSRFHKLSNAKEVIATIGERSAAESTAFRLVA